MTPTVLALTITTFAAKVVVAIPPWGYPTATHREPSAARYTPRLETDG